MSKKLNRQLIIFLRPVKEDMGMSSQGPTMRDYFLGGVLGNTPFIFLIFFLTFFEASDLLANAQVINSITLASMFGGALLASLLLLTKTQLVEFRRIMAMGIVTGLCCFIVYFLLSILVIPRLLPDFLIYLTFTVGGAFGAFFIYLTRRYT